MDTDYDNNLFFISAAYHNLATYSYLLIDSSFSFFLVILMTATGITTLMVYLGWYQTHGPPSHTHLSSCSLLG